MIVLDPDVFDTVAQRGRSALAWEVLRRDPAYRTAYSGLAVRPSVDISAAPAFVADWGLHFR